MFDELDDSDFFEQGDFNRYGEVRKPYKGRSRKLSNAERVALLELVTKSEQASEGRGKKFYVADASMPWPLCHRHYWFFRRSPKTLWPSDFGHPLNEECNFDGRMWSFLPHTLFGRYRPGFTTPLQHRLNTISAVLGFCDAVAWKPMMLLGRDFVNPWPRFCVESTDRLVASHRFDGEAAAAKWLAKLGMVFNDPQFLTWLKQYDTDNGCNRWTDPAYEQDPDEEWSEEDDFLRGFEYPSPLLSPTFAGWLPDITMPFDRLEVIAKENGYRGGDHGAMSLMAGLLGRGYVTSHGQRKSYDFRCFVPECVSLTGTGWQRGKELG